MVVPVDSIEPIDCSTSRDVNRRGESVCWAMLEAQDHMPLSA